MNSRPFILLLTFLWFQAGAAFWKVSLNEVAEALCAKSCCDHEVAAACCCLEEGPDKAPQEPLPVAPPAKGREVAPQVVWTPMEWRAPPRHDEVHSKGEEIDHGTVRMALPRSLRVLHCSFLM